jgi:predicted SprT family Zn-dependent metalloprotease
MNIQELSRKTKSELFELEKMLKRVEDPSLSREDILKARSNVKHVLYECDCCTHATIRVEVDKDGEERQYFVKDCGKAICPYRKHFLKIAKQEEKKTVESSPLGNEFERTMPY